MTKIIHSGTYLPCLCQRAYQIVHVNAPIAFCPLTNVWLAIQQDAHNIHRVGELVDYFTNTWNNGNQHQPKPSNHIEGMRLYSHQ